MIRKYTGQWTVAVAGLAILVMGTWTMYVEAMPNFRGGTTAIARLATVPSGKEPIGLTILSQHRALLDCEQFFRSSRSLEMQYLPQSTRDQLPTVCGQLATSVLGRAPIDSFAWLIRAAASAEEGEEPGFNTALRSSQLSGPNEGWLASMRLEVGEANWSLLSADTLIGHERDMQVAASAYIYAPVVARRYVSDTAFRARMNKVLETMQPASQRRFLTIVRATLTASGR
jgi:hypothetical protein